MAVDDLTTQGARSSAAVALTLSPRLLWITDMRMNQVSGLNILLKEIYCVI